MNNIRNFSIIAHVDHGKSTLSDRLIQICGGLDYREMGSQVLDSMELERERGITIKAQSVTLHYRSFNGELYQLNFIDTPGHVDFSYEVSRSLAACEGVLLVIDTTQGIGAQTISHFRVAQSMNLEIILVLNKIDLPIANPDFVLQDVKNILNIDNKNAILCSAKTGFGILELLEHLVLKIPPPKGKIANPLQALIIDSWFDNYLGVVCLICVKNGILRLGDKIKSMGTGKNYFVNQLGIFTPKKINCKVLSCGEVGWLVCAIKDITNIPVGDTLTLFSHPSSQSLCSFKKIKPHVYATIFSLNLNSYKFFRDALVKLSLNDASLSYEPVVSSIFGGGFRCGFLGLLHMDIVKERLEREYALNIIITVPTVNYEILTTSDEIVYIDNPSKLLHINPYIKEIREPIVECSILLPKQFFGNISSICAKNRGVQRNITYHGNYVNFIYDIPMIEVLLNLFDQIKSESRGYASFEYEFKCFSPADIVCVKFLINKVCIDELSLIIHRKFVVYRCRELINKLKKLIPRQQFVVVIQAIIGKRVLVSSTIKQLRKDVTEKCYGGGDIDRKKKLLQKQKKGKRYMKKLGNIVLPKSVFSAIFDIKNSKY
ncbi:elongation factor 4 [Blochmannia endosymbiont of Colobopsis nipponica]|uniref:translation elongation factor 4 n=1 Tax=Blochmannia endosymbiont of Colobopsis nipponica TaxID=2681987 RepID=UPI00177C11B7|nr:translation elongation factor 4 [Blochmannia endosymbiont of Colobopsis nipponica]QOI10930.1 elongation factor 4 [Blochmannia endosymbiont of Colobopsis nipponica]